MRHTTNLDQRISARRRTGERFAQWAHLGAGHWVPLAAARLLGRTLGAPALSATLDPREVASGSATYTGKGARYVLRTYSLAALQARKPRKVAA